MVSERRTVGGQLSEAADVIAHADRTEGLFGPDNKVPLHVWRVLDRAGNGLRSVAADPDPDLRGLTALAAISDAVDVILQASVLEAREKGLTWQAIGDALGMTRQAAQQRFGRA